MAMKIKTRQSRERRQRVTGREVRGVMFEYLSLKEMPLAGTLWDKLRYLRELGKNPWELVADTAILSKGFPISDSLPTPVHPSHCSQHGLSRSDHSTQCLLTG